MGRPITNQALSSITFTSAWIPGASAPSSNVSVLRQSSNSVYSVTDGTFTGLVQVINGPGPITQPGFAYVNVVPFGGGPTEYMYNLESTAVKTFQDNVYQWTPSGAPTTIADITINTSGSGYNGLPIITFTGGGATVSAVAHATVTATTIASVNVLIGGAGYTSIPSVTFSGGGASVQATCTTPTVGVNSAVTAGTGSTYIQSDVGKVLTVVGGTGTSATLTITQVNNGSGTGDVTGVSITTVGSYTAIPTSPVSVTGSTTGSGATFTLKYMVLTCPVATAGTGYTGLPTITFSTSGSTTSAFAVAVFTPTTLASVVIDSAGVGYTSIPTVTFSGGGASVQATGTVGLTLLPGQADIN